MGPGTPVTPQTRQLSLPPQGNRPLPAGVPCRGGGGPGHSPGQAGGDAEQVHDVAGVAVLAEDHLQETSHRP